MANAIVVDTRALNTLARTNPGNMAAGLDLLLKGGYDIYIPNQVLEELARAPGPITTAQTNWIEANRISGKVKLPPTGFTFNEAGLTSRQRGDESTKQLTQYLNRNGEVAT